jgi:hypothetical protein
MQFRDLMSVGVEETHKIKSGPVENTASKRKSQMLYPNAMESFEED